MLEPIAAEVHANVLSARGSIVSVNIRVMLEDLDAQLSYTDMMLLKVGAEGFLTSFLYVSWG